MDNDWIEIESKSQFYKLVREFVANPAIRGSMRVELEEFYLENFFGGDSFQTYINRKIRKAGNSKEAKGSPFYES